MTREQLAGAIRSLPNGDKKVLALHVLDAVDDREIAKRLGWTVAEVNASRRKTMQAIGPAVRYFLFGELS